MTPAWDSAVRRDTDRLRNLLDGSADVDARDAKGQTALMRAARAGDLDLARWLTAHGAALDRTAKYGLSALMLAVLNGHAAVVRVLAEAGADRTLVGSGAAGFAGRTALDLATARGDPATIEPLSRAAPRRPAS